MRKIDVVILIGFAFVIGYRFHEWRVMQQPSAWHERQPTGWTFYPDR